MLEDPYVEPYTEDASHTAKSLEYVPQSDLEAYPEEDDDEDPKEDPVDNPVDGGDNGDDEEGSSEDDEDDDMDIKADEEEEEHPAPSDSVVVALQAAEQAPSAEETESFETDESTATTPPHPAYRMTFRISIPAPVPVPAWSDSKVARLLAMSTPPSSPLSPLSLPPPRIPFLPLPSILSPPSYVLSPTPPPSPIRSLGYQAAMIRLRAEAASTSHSPPLPPPFILSPTRSDAPSSMIPPPLPISAPTSSPPLQLPSASRREDRPKVTLPPRKKLGITLGPRYEVGESSSVAAARPVGGLRADYSFVATMDREIRRDPKREVGYGITDSWDEIVQDTDEIYSRLDDEQSERQLLAGRLNMLFRDRRAHAYTSHLMETKARLSREAWVRSMDTSDLTCGEVMSLRTTVLGQTTEIRELHVADRRRQIVTSEMLRADHRRFPEIRGLRTADRTGDHTTGTCDHTTGTGEHTTRIGDSPTGTARDALRSINGDDSRNSETGVRRTERATRECTYTDFLKCQPLHFKVTEGVASLSQWRMFPEESDKIERYIRGLLDMIHRSVVASKPKTMQEAVEISTELMDKKNCTFAERETESKRKSTANTNNANNQKGTMSGQKPTCYECGVQGHFKREFPKLNNNNNYGNQGGRDNAPAKVYAVGRAATDPDSNVVTVIACAKKIVYIPWGNETLIIHGYGSNQGNTTRLNIISCTKTENYMMKGFPIFLAHVTTKEVEDKSEKKRLEDVPIVQNFPEVFPEDLLGLPPTRPVEFQIDLVPGAAPFLHHSSANSWQWDLHSSGSGNTLHWQWELILPWDLHSSGSGNTLYWQWELILPVGTFSWQWECLVHFIPNNKGQKAFFDKQMFHNDRERKMIFTGGFGWVIVVINPLYLTTVSFGVDAAIDMKEVYQVFNAVGEELNAGKQS
nr:reverse transcriptase domain-containing protein [Tanacetum cinerariifolium]